MSEKERKAFIASGDLISIADAAEYTPYSAEYLSLRARTGHLKATKIARNWLTTRGAVLSYLRSQQKKHARVNNSNSTANSNRSVVYQLNDQDNSVGNTRRNVKGNDRKVVL